MQLHRLTLVNFRQHADTDIVFGPGITAIIGPNGSGKTTLLEAIAWAFYGNAAARGSRDSLRWDRAPARSSVRVEVIFSLGSHEFRVVRGLYNAELFQDRGDAPIANSQQEVTSRIERLLGMTRDEFFNTYFTGQKELSVMAAMGPTERARFLSRVLGYEKLRLVQDKGRETRSALRAELAGLERGLGDPAELTKERDDAGRRLTEARAAVAQSTKRRAKAERALAKEGPAWTKMVELRESVLSLDGERRVAERDVEEARREFGRLDRALAEALAAQSGLAELSEPLARVEPLRREVEALEAEARAAGRRRSLTGQLGELEGQLERVRDRSAALAGAAAGLETAKRALQEARSRLKHAEGEEEKTRTAWVRDGQDAETKLQTLRDQYVDFKKNREQVVEAGPRGACPICKRPLGNVYEEMLATLDRQMEEVEVKGKFFRQRLEQLASEPAEVREAERRAADCAKLVEEAVQEVARWESRMKEATEIEKEVARLDGRRGEIARALAALPDAYDATRHEAAREELKTLEPVVARAAELRVTAAKAEQLVAEAEAAERTLSEREARLTGLATAIAALGFSEEAFVQARERYDAAAAALRALDVELATLKGDLKAAEAAHASAVRRLREREEREARAREVRVGIDLHDELDRALHDLRLELNTAMRPELSDRASVFLSDLTDARYNELELDEEYQVLVIEEAKGKPVISGGEEDVTNLVLRLAISQMVAERAGQPLSLLVLDEIFGSLDEHRRRNVVDLLRRLGDRFPQVVLITHIESIKDGADRVLRVALDTTRGAAVVTDEGGSSEGDYVAA